MLSIKQFIHDNLPSVKREKFLKDYFEERELKHLELQVGGSEPLPPAREFFIHFREDCIDADVSVQVEPQTISDMMRFADMAPLSRQMAGPGLQLIEKQNKITQISSIANKKAQKLAKFFDSVIVDDGDTDPFGIVIKVVTNPIGEIAQLFKYLVCTSQNIYCLIDPTATKVLMSQDLEIREPQDAWKSIFSRFIKQVVNASRSDIVMLLSSLVTASTLFSASSSLPSTMMSFITVAIGSLQVVDRVTNMKKILSKFAAIKSSISSCISWRNFLRLLLFIGCIYAAKKAGSAVWNSIRKLFRMESTTDVACASTVDDAVKISLALLLAFLGYAMPFTHVDRLMRASTFVGATPGVVNSISEFITFILEKIVALTSSLGWDTISDYIRNNSSLSEKLLGQHGELNRLNRDLERFLNQRPTPVSGPGTSSFTMEGHALLARCSEIAMQLTELENSYMPLSMLFGMRRRLELAISNGQFISDFRDSRIEPFSILISGPPRIGKTYAANVLRLALQKVFERNSALTGPLEALRQCAIEGKWTYTRNFADAFWSGYNHEPIVVYDDIFARNTATKVPSAVERHDSELLELQALISSQPYSPPFPEIGAGIPCPKGTRINPRLVMMTSNFMLPNAAETDPSIIDDRIHMLLLTLPTGMPQDSKLSNVAFYKCRVPMSRLRTLMKNSNYNSQSSFDPFPSTLDDFEQWNMRNLFVEIEVKEILEMVIDGLRSKILNFESSQVAVDNIVNEVVEDNESPIIAQVIQWMTKNGVVPCASFATVARRNGLSFAISCSDKRGTKLRPKVGGALRLCISNGTVVENADPTHCGCPAPHRSELTCPAFQQNSYVFEFDMVDLSPFGSLISYDNGEFLMPQDVPLDRKGFIIECFNAWRSHFNIDEAPIVTLRQLESIATNQKPRRGFGFHYSKSNALVRVCSDSTTKDTLWKQGKGLPQTPMLWVPLDNVCSEAATNDWYLVNHYCCNDQNIWAIRDLVKKIHEPPEPGHPLYRDWCYFVNDVAAGPQFHLPRGESIFNCAVLMLDPQMVASLPPKQTTAEKLLQLCFLYVYTVSMKRTVRYWRYVVRFGPELDVSPERSTFAHIVITDGETDYQIDGVLAQEYDDFACCDVEGDLANVPQDLKMLVWHTVHGMINEIRPQTWLARIQLMLKRLAQMILEHPIALLLGILTAVVSTKLVKSLFSESDKSNALSMHQVRADFLKSQPPVNAEFAELVHHRTFGKKCRFCPQVQKVAVSTWDPWKHSQVLIQGYQEACKKPTMRNAFKRFLKALHCFNAGVLIRSQSDDEIRSYLRRCQHCREVPITFSGTYSPLTIANSLLCQKSKKAMFSCLQEQQMTIKQLLGADFHLVDPDYCMPITNVMSCKIEPKVDHRPCWSATLLEKQSSRDYRVTNDDCTCTCDNTCALDISILPPVYPPELQSQQARYARTVQNLVVIHTPQQTSRGLIIAPGKVFVCAHGVRDVERSPQQVTMIGVFGTETFTVSKDDLELTGTDFAILHVPTMQVPNLNCKHALMDAMPNAGAALTVHWLNSRREHVIQRTVLGKQTTSQVPLEPNYTCYEADNFPGAVEGNSGAIVMCGPQILGHYYGVRPNGKVLILPWVKRDYERRLHTPVVDTLIAGDNVDEHGKINLVKLDTKKSDAIPPSEIRPSVLADSLCSLNVPNVKAPAALDQEALTKAFDKFAPVEENFDPAYEASATELGNYLARLMKAEFDQECEPLRNWSEVVQGVHNGIPIAKPVVMTTSPGYPYSENGIGKKDLLKGVPPKIAPTEQFEDRLNEVERQFLAGDCTPYLCTVNLKDELRDLERVAQKKTRLFCATPIHMNMLYRKYCLIWIHHYKKLPVQLSLNAMGSNVFGEDWKDISDWLSNPTLIRSKVPTKHMMLAGDFSRFDTSHSRWRILQAFRVIAIGCTHYDEVMRLGHMLANYMVMHDGVACRVPAGLPSGCQVTTPLNCILNTLLWLTIWRKCTGYGLDHFLAHTRLVVYGDDVIFSMAKNSSYRSAVTIERIVSIMKSNGYTFESADSLPLRWQDLNEVTFLKRHFVPDSYDTRIMHAPRNIDEVWTQLYWARRELSMEELKTVFLSAALEFGQHGPEEIEKANEILEIAVKMTKKRYVSIAFYLSNFRAVAYDAWNHRSSLSLDTYEQAKRYWRLW